jgi:D-alanine-D-alanine ligase
MTIKVLYSLPTKTSRGSVWRKTEEDTVLSAQKIAQALEKIGYTTRAVGIHKNNISSQIRKLSADVFFNCIDWTGRDFPLTLAGVRALEARGIPFTGASYANTLYTDKVEMKKALAANHIPTPAWMVYKTGEEVHPDLSFPCIVKLGCEHCSIGIDASSVVYSEDELRSAVREKMKDFHMPVLVEQFVTGREFQVTVLERKDGLAVLPAAEIIYTDPKELPLLTFTSRWDEESLEYKHSKTILPTLSDSLQKTFTSLCRKTFRALLFSDYSRIDLRMDGAGTLLVLEANPNPGLDEDPQYSMTMSGRAVGLSFEKFLEEIVFSALRRFRKEGTARTSQYET